MVTVAVGALSVLVSCGGSSALGDGPYKYVFRPVKLPEGATGALAGRAIGNHHTKLDFGVALGREPRAVPVPRAGTGEAYGYLYGGVIYTNDLQVPGKRRKWVAGPQFHTAAQWEEGINMSAAMEEKLCEAATGEPCHEG